MMLSVIIVNYNVKYFLEQCLHSALQAPATVEAEIIVIDNASTDGSVEYLQPLYPEVKFITSKENMGFAKANNLALKKAKGEYVLFLNPDTLVPEDCFEKCVRFMENNLKAGALGIRMLDGSGKFLAESKRSFPTASTAFYKLIGLSVLFPKSKIFNKYSLGYLDEYENHVVDVLAGAFMLVRKSVLEEVGSFDETFFMYAEDVDLSYRIQKAGYENWYFAGSSIIHFKGESTKKGSLNYVRMFYNAMSVFVKKHYTGERARAFVFSIQLAIWVRAFFAWVKSFSTKAGLPILDAGLIFLSLKFTTDQWEHYVRDDHYFIPSLVNTLLPAYTIVFLVSAALTGIYDNSFKPIKAFLSAGAAIIVLLAVYSLLPEQWRFSRGVILFGGILAALLITLSRWLLLKLGFESKVETRQNQTVIIGNSVEYNECYGLLEKSHLEEKVLGRIKIHDDVDDAVGTLHQLTDIVKTTNIREVIFCNGVLKYSAIIDVIQKLPTDFSFRFHAFKSSSIIGSDSKDTSGEVFSSTIDYSLAKPSQKRMKRICDVTASILFLLSFPIHLLLIKKGGNALKEVISIFLGAKTWISYYTHNKQLPQLKKGILSPNGFPLDQPTALQEIHLFKIDQLYAKDYDWVYDLKLILKNYRRLGGCI
jgi:GT2 family glycosyltransferase